MTEIATEGDPDRLQIEIATVAGVEGGRGTEEEGTPDARGPHRDHPRQASTKKFYLWMVHLYHAALFTHPDRK